ncbi:unnamed protein product [Orchesella dallaii]|uniref:Uncharacterized protein n=1 Tax=Orchesella dallaii TaxID=48710 RepID=A0ABP1S4H3_9HEXA
MFNCREERKKSLSKSRGLVNLKEIKRPEDLGVVAHERKVQAQERNAKLLQDLDIEAGKLHTRRLCPIHERLAEQKAKFLRDIHCFQQHQTKSS